MSTSSTTSRSSWRADRLKPGKLRKCKKKVFGFDIETHGDKNEFLCASIVGEDEYEFFTTDKQKLIDEFQHRRFRNSLIAATNLSFDFFGTFNDTPEMNKFQTLFRGSSLLYAKTWLDDKNNFFLKPKGKKAKGTLVFIDTLNYAQLSVEKMGNILGIKKLDMKECIGQIPKNYHEWVAMKRYNIRDSIISMRFIRFLYDGFEALGASPRLTIASTALSLFRNEFLQDTFFVQKEEDINDLMTGYYGGRTEVFKRGVIKDANYYDINSMYPYCMTKELPDPNSHRVTYKDVLDYINDYEGMSKVNIIAPKYLKIPYLPFRYKGKLIFPTGSFSGWYSHLELRKAINLGYTITKVFKTHYYKKTCTPLKDYAVKLYDLRLRQKSEKSSMQLVTKLLLNSLYGKFAQKFKDRETYTPISNFTYEEINGMSDFERIGDFIRHKHDTHPAAFCIPIWAAYITAHARDMLYNYLSTCDPWYCDTDSIVTKNKITEGTGLGEMKLEMGVKEGVIIKPKMYAFIDDNENKIVKIKGVKKKVLVGEKEVELDYDFFMGLQEDNTVEYKRFIKFKEAMRRGLTVNEIINFSKTLDLEDTKREWNTTIDWGVTERSSPLHMIEGIEQRDYAKYEKLAYEMQKELEKAKEQQFINSDLFDSHAVGGDISSEEFLENERFFALND